MRPNFSKWITFDLLVDPFEIKNLLDTLSPVHLISLQNAQPETPFLMTQDQFLEVYSYYISQLQSQKTPSLESFKKAFYLMISSSFDKIFIRKLENGKEFLVTAKPLIEVKPISLVFSQVDQSLRAAPYHPDGILWGLRFSFPQLMQNPSTLETEDIRKDNSLEAALFVKLRRWVREYTLATPFIIDSKKINLPVRLGKNCLSWINFHPDLKKFNIQVAQ